MRNLTRLTAGVKQKPPSVDKRGKRSREIATKAWLSWEPVRLERGDCACAGMRAAIGAHAAGGRRGEHRHGRWALAPQGMTELLKRIEADDHSGPTG
jgi:hypothetical protein